MALQRELEGYVERVVGEPCPIQAAPASITDGIPIYLANVFEILCMKILGHTLTLAMANEHEKPDLSQLCKYRGVLMERLGVEVILVLPQIASHERRRLIQKAVPFIVPGRQMFLPMLLVDLRESFPGPLRTPRKQTLGWVAQLIVLRHLLANDIVDRPLAQIAGILGYSPMAISQAVDELVSLHVCQRVDQGRSKSLGFEGASRALWRSTSQLMRTPVKKSLCIRDRHLEHLRTFQAGMTALANMTDIVSGRTRTIAMSNTDFNLAVNAGTIENCPFEDDDTCTLQVWAYDPALLARGPEVDRLSLYLSMKNSSDERVQVALEKLSDTLH
ncbi:MAG: hypothetical protein HYV27_01180 [Candidatus Hydrogenedentes bacterium]|nr:hypothetical protein [Candidatus Hydrogenedentota bacterium]